MECFEEDCCKIEKPTLYPMEWKKYWDEIETNGSFCHPCSAPTNESAYASRLIWEHFKGRIEPDPNMHGCYRIKP